MAGLNRKLYIHCGEMLAPRTYREHVRLYYDENSHTWTKRRRIECSNTTSTSLGSGRPECEKEFPVVLSEDRASSTNDYAEMV